MKITHCIFDLDGTFINTENIYSDALRTLNNQYNFKNIFITLNIMYC